jgi:hypothetical protein
MSEKRSAFTISVGTPEGKSRLGNPKRRRGDNIRMILKRVCGCTLD